LTDVTKFIFTWITVGGCPCKKCLSLNGKTWADQSIYNPVLVDDLWGPIWDLQNDLPLTHPHCQCFLEVSVWVDMSFDPSLIEFAEELDKCRVI
jgi:hypothetical protein